MKKLIPFVLALVLICAAAAPAVGEADVDTSMWSYYTFEGSGVAMKLPADFTAVTDEPEEGVFYNCGDDDVVLKVTPVDGDFDDYGALAEYCGGQAGVTGVEQTTVNGVDLLSVTDEDGIACVVISAEGTVYRFAFAPKSENGSAVSEAIRSTICPSGDIPFEPKTIEPMPYDIDLSAPEDGMYPALFGPADLANGALTFRIFTEDCYDIVDINLLDVGDTIVIDGEDVVVQSLDYADDLFINGGLDEDGWVLRAYDEDNCWKVAMEDDYSTYTDQGETTLPLDDAVTFTDGWDIEKDPVTVSGAEAVAEAIAGSENESFDPYSTTVTVSDGKVVEIYREYTP